MSTQEIVPRHRNRRKRHPLLILLSILLALSHPEGKVIAHIPDEERRRIAQIAADGFVNNIVFVQ